MPHTTHNALRPRPRSTAQRHRNQPAWGPVITHVSGISQLRRHPLAALLWLSGAAFIALSFPLDNGHVGRAGLFIGLIAAIITARDLSLGVVARIAQIIALYEEDVQLDSNAPECLVSDLSRARRLRAASRRARRIVR